MPVGSRRNPCCRTYSVAPRLCASVFASVLVLCKQNRVGAQGSSKKCRVPVGRRRNPCSRTYSVVPRLCASVFNSVLLFSTRDVARARGYRGLHISININIPIAIHTRSGRPGVGMRRGWPAEGRTRWGGAGRAWRAKPGRAARAELGGAS